MFLFTSKNRQKQCSPVRILDLMSTNDTAKGMRQFSDEYGNKIYICIEKAITKRHLVREPSMKKTMVNRSKALWVE